MRSINEYTYSCNTLHRYLSFSTTCLTVALYLNKNFLIPEELISALKGVWERVINQSEDRIQIILTENLKIEVEKLSAQHNSVTAHLADTLNELARQTQAQQHWQTQYQALQIKCDELNKQYMELQTQHAISSIGEKNEHYTG